MINLVHVGGNGLMHLLKPPWETMSSILRFCIHMYASPIFIIRRPRSPQPSSKNPPTPVLSSGFTSTVALLKLDFKVVKIDLLNMES